MSALIEPFFYCLIASVIWAPVVYLLVARSMKDTDASLADKVWPTALVLASLPTLAAPFVASMGFSLRGAAPLPPMGGVIEPGLADAAITMTANAGGGASSVSLATILSAGAALYFYGFVLFLVLGLVRHVWFAYRVKYAFDLDEPALEAALESWRGRMGIKTKPRYAFTDVVNSVCVHGFFRPVILMPEALLDRVSITDAALMGAHEMAHIKRGDTYLFAFCTVAKAVFWFNPFIQHIAARASLAAEQSADALVIKAGASRRDYAHCFVEGLKFAAGTRFAGRELVPSFTPFDKKSRRDRLDAILSATGGEPSPHGAKTRGIIITLASVGAIGLAQAAFAVSPKPVEDTLSQTPVDGKVTFGYREQSKVLGSERRYHEGIDIAAAHGSLVKAAGDGKVIAATKRYNDQPAWGNVVVIDHGHGLVTRYAHLDSYIVRKGDHVKAGETIGAVGSTGRSTGPHLHFEVIQDGEQIDPAPVITAAAPLPAPRPVKAETPVIKAQATIFPAPVAIDDIAPAVAPAPAAMPAPKASPALAPVEAPAPLIKTGGRTLDQKLAGKIDKFVANLEGFPGFEEFDDLTIEFDEFDFEGVDVDDLKDRVASMQFNFDPNGKGDIFVPDFSAMVEGIPGMSEEQLQRIREDQHRALEHARDEFARAREEMQRHREHGERDRERAERELEHAERDRERAFALAERDRERAERDREEAMARAQKDHEELREYFVKKYDVNEKEMLRLRERALKEAREDLDQQLAEIQQRRAELSRKERRD